MYGLDSQTIPEMSMYLWEIGYALQIRYTGEWAFASVHTVSTYGPDDIVVTGDASFEAASELPNCNPAVCSVFLDAVRRHVAADKTRKNALKRKAARYRARKNGKDKKDKG